MMLTLRQWTMAFAAALATHALSAVLLPHIPSQPGSDPPPSPKPIRLSLVATAPALPAPAPSTPPVVRQPEPVPPPAAKVVEPSKAKATQPAPVPTAVQQVPLTQQSVVAINPVPVATEPMPSDQSATAINDDNSTADATKEAPSSTATSVEPTPVPDAIDLDQLQSQYGKTAHHWLNQRKRYPPRAAYRGDEGTVLVTFVVNRYGEVLSHALERSSGNPLLDKEALALIRRAQPLPVFPDELAEVKDTITVLVTIPFKLR